MRRFNLKRALLLISALLVCLASEAYVEIGSKPIRKVTTEVYTPENNSELKRGTITVDIPQNSITLDNCILEAGITIYCDDQLGEVINVYVKGNCQIGSFKFESSALLTTRTCLISGTADASLKATIITVSSSGDKKLVIKDLKLVLPYVSESGNSIRAYTDNGSDAINHYLFIENSEIVAYGKICGFGGLVLRDCYIEEPIECFQEKGTIKKVYEVILVGYYNREIRPYQPTETAPIHIVKDKDYLYEVNNVRVKARNARDVLGNGKVNYSSLTNTLYLDNLNLTASNSNNSGIATYTAANGPLTIMCKGDNTISGFSDGIFSDYGNVIIKGADNSSTLTIDGCQTGIYFDGNDLTVSDNVKLTIQNCQGSALSLAGGSLTVNSTLILKGNGNANTAMGIGSLSLGTGISIEDGVTYKGDTFVDSDESVTKGNVIIGDDTVTGITSVNTTPSTVSAYDLTGRQVPTAYKGIVIKNGKKFVQ